jgi:hypothetical protein
MPPVFRTDNRKLQSAYDAALGGLKENLTAVFRFERPVLIEGAGYNGVWLECAPQEGLVYASVNEQAAVANHDVFFALQREDGYLPCYVWAQRMGTGQIQMVVPIAATAWELFALTQDEAFLTRAYAACSRWDEWLRRHRDTRGTGLCEAFCEYDTGHDNSPRWKGLPHSCPNGDAAVCPDAPGLPYLAPDLSATVYGGRVALAAMAQALGKKDEANQWIERAETVRRAIMEHCFDPEEACFYDVDAAGEFVRIRGDVLTRVLGEGVVGQDLFEEVYRSHIRNPEEFWAPYPLPSIALNDPAFDKAMPANSWGGPSQALTALRAPRWMERYGKHADMAHMMQQWVRALAQAGAFTQQLNPWTGEPIGPDGYSPAMLVLLDFTARLCGVRAEGQGMEWNCRLPEGAEESVYRLPAAQGSAELRVSRGGAELLLAGRKMLTVRGTARVLTDARGRATTLVGTAPGPEEITLTWPDGGSSTLAVQPDEEVLIHSTAV